MEKKSLEENLFSPPPSYWCFYMTVSILFDGFCPPFTIPFFFLLFSFFRDKSSTFPHQFPRAFLYLRLFFSFSLCLSSPLPFKLLSDFLLTKFRLCGKKKFRSADYDFKNSFPGKRKKGKCDFEPEGKYEERMRGNFEISGLKIGLLKMVSSAALVGGKLFENLERVPSCYTSAIEKGRMNWRHGDSKPRVIQLTKWKVPP